MSEFAQIVVAIVAPVVVYLIWDAKRTKQRLTTVEERLDVAHHRNYKARILINQLVSYIRNFCNGAYEVMETSRDTQQPVTDRQIQRLRKSGNVDDILRQNKD